MITYTLLIVKMFKLPGLIRCEPPADYLTSMHLPYPGDCLNLGIVSALSPRLHCSVACSNIIIQVIIHSYTAVMKMLINSL